MGFGRSARIVSLSPPVTVTSSVSRLTAAALARLGRDAEALADVERLEKIAPEIGKKLRREFQASAVPYTDIAKQEFRAGNYQAAISQCDSALTYDPRLGDALVVKALALHKLGDIGESA